MANQLLKTLSLGNEQMDIWTPRNFLDQYRGELRCFYGYHFDEGDSISVPSGTTVHAKVLSKTSRKFNAVTWSVDFPANASGVRYAGLECDLSGDGTTPVLLTSLSRLKAAPSGVTMLTGFDTVWYDPLIATQTFWLRLYQNSGSTMTVDYRCRFFSDD